MRRMGGAVLAVTGVLACPCHLVVTLPLLAGLLAGTALGNVLTHNPGLVYTGASIYFVGALALGSWFWFSPARGKRKAGAACSTCAPGASKTPGPVPSPLQEDRPAPRK